MLGAIIGDIAGSRFEFQNCKSKDFKMFSERCSVTDDSILTLAVAGALTECRDWDDRDDALPDAAVKWMQRLGRRYPDAGYGARFIAWLEAEEPRPYNSFGNGSAMRVSPCAYAADDLDQVLSLARAVTAVTHDHPEGLKGAEAVAGAVFLARTGAGKPGLRRYIERLYGPLDFTIDGIRDAYRFNETCQGSVPQAMEAFFESTDFEDAVRTAVSLGGDSDTVAAMCGSVAGAYYGIPEGMSRRAAAYLDGDLTKILADFEAAFPAAAG